MSESREDFGAQVPQLRTPPPGVQSRTLVERLLRVESRNVTFRAQEWPVFWEAASGANVRDVDGNVYLDLNGAFGVALLGHNPPIVRSALADQAERLLHGMGDVHPPAVKVELLEALARLSPWPDTRVVLSSTGSEAVETALKTALLATGRAGVVAFEGSYHGLTMGSLAVTHRNHFRGPFAQHLYQGVDFVPFPDFVDVGADPSDRILDAVHRRLREGVASGVEVGAVVVEPVQARGGARIPPPGFMAELSQLTRDAGVILIADEIYTGLGRCGAFLASQLVGLEPDLVCVGKSLGGGLPLSACLGPADVMDAWPDSDGEAIHTSTFLGHPLACAVAVAVLGELEAGRVATRAAKEGARLLGALRARLGTRPDVADVRGLGMLLGIEFMHREGAGRGRAARVGVAALERGLIVLAAGDHGHVLELSPPLGLTDQQIAFALDALVEAVEVTAP